MSISTSQNEYHFLQNEILEKLSTNKFALPDGPNANSCPACAALPANSGITQAEVDRTQELLGRWATALLDKNPKGVTATYCDDGFLWGTVSNHRRYGHEEIESYFDYFANLDNKVNGVCPQVTKIAEGVYEDDRAVDLTSEGNTVCVRMTYVMKRKEDQTLCIDTLYSSFFPRDPKDLQIADEMNNMPWTPENNVTIQPVPINMDYTAKDECPACDPLVHQGVSQDDSAKVLETLDGWVSALLSRNASNVAATYCDDAFLWGTVSDFRRLTNQAGLPDYSPIESYFDWFATKENHPFGVCSNVRQISENLFADDRTVRLSTDGPDGDQGCLRMHYTVAKEGAKWCVKTLQSSYFPMDPQELQQTDANNGMPWATTSAPTPGSASRVAIASSLMAVAAVALNFFL